MSRLLRRTLIGVGIGVVVYVAAIVVFGARDLADSLAGFAWAAIAWALLLSSANYLLRFWKWELALGWLEIRAGSGGQHPPTELKLGRSLEIYLAGLSMSVTPGKVGEVLRSVLLRASNGIPFTRTAMVVVADRLSDLVALVVLALIGISDFQEYLPHVIVALVVVAAGVVVLGSPRLFGGILDGVGRIPKLAKLADQARELIASSAALLKLPRLGLLSAISVLGWGLECVGYWLILNAFPGVEASLRLCVFLWSATTLLGALSFLPGGLGATEGSLGLLVARFALGVSSSVALASTLLIRLCTLWYGELVGAVALLTFMREPQLRAAAREAAPDLSNSAPPPPTDQSP
jgi:glycosyltransferase 2 family protein